MRNVVFILILLFSSIISHAQFQKLIGNTNNNRAGKMILHANHYYVLGQNGTKATVTKLTLAGILVWTNQTSEDGWWNDVIVNKDGNLMAVGYQGISTLPNNWNSNVGIINANNGSFISIKTYNFAFRDFFSKIFINPFPSNSMYPYYIVGAQVNISGFTRDVGSINMMDSNGDINLRRVLSGPDDLEIFHGFWINTNTGDFTLIGGKEDGGVVEGVAVNFDKHATSTFMTEINNPVSISNIIQIGFSFIYSGQTADAQRKAFIWKQVGNTNYSYTIDGLSNILNIFLDPTGTILFALGVESASPNRRVLLTLDNTQNTIPITGARYFTNGETTFADGFANLASNQKILFTDSRTGNPNTLGQQDGLALVLDLSLQNCLSETTSGFVLRPYAITTSINSVVNVENSPPAPQLFTGTTFSYQTSDPCAPPCNITSQIQNQNTGCGLYQFQIQSGGGTGPYSYQWDFNCDGTNEHTGSLISHSFSNPGTQQYCITVTDAIGCTATDSKTIVVVGDFLPPVITCPPHITVECADDILADLAETGNATATDDVDPNPDLLYEDNIQGSACSYISTRVWTATDNCQRTNSCTQLITVIDRLAPEIVCPPNLTLSCDADLFDNMFTGNATATDQCGNSFLITSSLGNGQGGSCNSMWPKTYTATDICGNSRSCTQTISLIDNVPPVILCPTDKTISCEQTPLPTLTGTAVAEDNCQTITLTPTYTDMNTGAGCEVAIIRTWTINDGCGNISSCQQTIQFDDFLPPNMMCPPDITISCETPADQINTGIATASDNCQTNLVIGYSDIVAGNNCNKIITRFWNTNDGCGNPGFCYQVITQTDITAPIINCPPNTTISCNAGTTPTNTGMATATDNCTVNINIRHTDAFTAQGCTQDLIRTWTAMDECENVNTCIQTITLIDDINPNVVCPPDLTISCGANNSPAFTGEPTVSDFCQSDLIVTYQDTSSGPPCDVTIIRTWTINDGCGNVSTCDQIIKLEDKTPPTFICPPSNINPIECTADPSLGAPSNVMDNCGGKIDQTKVDVFSTDGCFTTVARTWTVTDQCGNSATCNQVILMQDTKAPVITNCGRKFTVQGIRNPDGICYGNATISTPDVSDECSENVMITNSFNNTSNASSGNYPTGQTIVTWTAKDDCGNMVMCRDTVLVKECGSDKSEYCGQTVITCFSGYLNPNNPSSGINPNGNTIAIIDNRLVSNTSPDGWNSVGVPMRKDLDWVASKTGQVFGIAIDNNNDIYVSASTIYGNFPFGPAGPGGIYKIDHITGVVTTFVMTGTGTPGTNTLPNAGSGLGNICFDSQNNQFFVTNLQDGLIYRLNGTTGNVINTFNHAGSTNFASTHANFIPLGDRPFAVEVYNNRLYYTLWNEDSGRNSALIFNEVWSVPITSTTFGIGVCEIKIPVLSTSSYSNVPTDLEISDTGTMIIGERSRNEDIPTYVGSPAHAARVIEYKQNGPTGLNCSATWGQAKIFYIGNYSNNTNCSGGVDFGYGGYDQKQLTPFECDSVIWSSGDALKYGSSFNYYSGDNQVTYGLTGVLSKGNTNIPGPGYVKTESYYINLGIGKTTYGDVEIFKCISCPTDSTNCMNLAAAVKPTSMPDDSTCCYSLDITNNESTDVTKVCLDLFNSTDWIFNTVNVNLPGYSISPFTSTGLCIENSSGIPLGITSNVITFCLTELDPTAKDTQCIAVTWYKDQLQTECRDTIKTYCAPPTEKDTCFIISDIESACDPENDYAHCVTFTVTNISSTPAYGFVINGLPAGNIFADCGCGGTSYAGTGWAFDWFFTPLPVGGSTTVCVKIISGTPILETTQICFEGGVEGLQSCCKSPYPICAELEPCCIPCENINVVARPIENEKDSCCYALDLNYNCDYNYFSSVSLDILNPGVHFGYYNIGPSDWAVCSPSTSQSICISPIVPSIYSGSHPSIIEFCLTDINDPSEIPQFIQIGFNTLDSQGKDSIVCDTILEFECEDKGLPCTFITNETIDCIPDSSKYRITLTVQNISNPSFTAGFLTLLPLGGLTPNPIPLVPPLPNDGTTRTVTFCYTPSVFPDIDGKLILVYKLTNLVGDSCCNGNTPLIDTLILPNCDTMPCGITCEEELHSFPVENKNYGLLSSPPSGWYLAYNRPEVVEGGCHSSSQSVRLNGITNGYTGDAAGVRINGILGPITLFEKGKVYCMKFCAKVLPGIASATGYLRLRATDGSPVTVSSCTYPSCEIVEDIVLTNPNVWEEIIVYYAPSQNYTNLVFSNHTTDPLDGPGSILLDDVVISSATPVFNDVIPPDVMCPPSIVINDTNNDCIINYVIPVISATDDNGIASLECYLDGLSVPVGSSHSLDNSIVHIIKCVAVDICGNKDSCNYTITVRCDTIAEFCPNNIVQNGDFESGVPPDQPNTNDIANATGWGSVWTAAFPTPADYRNTGFVPGTVLNPLPASQGDFASMWLTNTTDANKRQAILNNLNSTILPNTGCYDLDFKIACIIPGGVGSPVLQVYGVPVAASPYTGVVDQSSPLNTSLMTGGTPILLGEYTVHTNNCTNNFTPVTFSFNSSIIPAGGINRIFFARRDLMTGELAGDTYIGLDDVCLSPAPCAQECTCNGISDLSIFGSATNFPISCGSHIGKLECNRDFGIHGNINCSSDNCPKTLDWEIKDGSSIVHSGTTTIYNALGHFDIYTFYTSSFVPGRTYTVNLMGNCGMDSCVCSFTFIVEDCSGCTCPQNPTFNLMEGDNAPIVVTCNQAPIQIPILECPINPITITSNNLLCTSPNPNIPCPDNVVSWTLDRPVLSNLSGAITGVGFSVGFSAADVADPGTYVLTTITLCGGDSCVCTIKWTQKDCNNEPLCNCGGFSKTKFCLLSTGDAVETECNLPNKVYNLPCPGTSLVNYCGTFKCTPDTCSPAVNFILTNTNTGAIIHTSGLTLNPMGKFTINLLPGWCNDPSVIYEIKVSGVCGNDTCMCTTKFRVDCPQQNMCKCDQNFNTDVAQGFLQSSGAGNCIRKFEPKSLCPGDKVDWYRNGTLVVTTTGMTSATFPILVGFGDVCMIVTRTESPNVVCRDTFCSRTYCKPELSENCIEIDNSEMVNNIDGYIDDDGTMINWTKDEGWPYAFADDGLSDGNIMLIASKDMPSAARTNRNGAPPKQGFLTFELDAESYLSTSIPEGTTLELEGITPTGQRVLLSNIDVAGIKKGWDGTIKRDIIMPQEIYSVVLRLSTTSTEPALLRIDNFCLYSTVGTNDIQNVNEFSIYPNPTTGELFIKFEEALSGDTKLEVIDFLGRVSSSQYLKSGTIIQAIDLAGKPSGVYVIRLTETGGSSAQRRVIKVE